MLNVTELILDPLHLFRLFLPQILQILQQKHVFFFGVLEFLLELCVLLRYPLTRRVELRFGPIQLGLLGSECAATFLKLLERPGRLG